MVIKDVFDNARRLGLPDKYLGFQWSAMFDIEQDLIKKGCKRKDLNDELDKKLIELQNDNYLKAAKSTLSKVYSHLGLLIWEKK